MVFWRTFPVFVVRRGAQTLAMLRDPDHLGQLADPNSKELQQPPYAQNAARSIKPEFAVLVGVCTHMGCTPQFYPQPHASEPVADWPGGYLCPCHGSQFNAATGAVEDTSFVCPRCGGLMDVAYDRERLPPPRSLREFEAKWADRANPLAFSGVWRF